MCVWGEFKDIYNTKKTKPFSAKLELNDIYIITKQKTPFSAKLEDEPGQPSKGLTWRQQSSQVSVLLMCYYCVDIVLLDMETTILESQLVPNVLLLCCYYVANVRHGDNNPQKSAH